MIRFFLHPPVELQHAVGGVMLCLLGAFLNRKMARVTVYVNGRVSTLEARMRRLEGLTADTLENGHGGPAALETPPDPHKESEPPHA